MTQSEPTETQENIKEKVIVALDGDDPVDLVNKLGDWVDWYKAGSATIPAMREDHDIVEFLNHENKKIFLDLKWYDIPSVIFKAAARWAERGVNLATAWAHDLEILEAAV